MKVMTTIILLLVFVFSGCNDKLILAKPPCIQMHEIIQPEVQNIRVKNDDVELYKAYINEFRGKINNQNLLIQKMNSNCIKWIIRDNKIDQ